MTAGALALALIAGVLSVLSPCVLPILPVVLGAAASEHRWGPAVLAIGLSVSFVAIGLFAATVGYSIGLDAEIFRRGAAALMVIAGTVLLVPRFQEQLALAGAPLANWSDRHFAGTRGSDLAGQLSLGCSARSGAPVSARRSERHRFWRRRAAISARLRPRCWLSGWAPAFRLRRWGSFRATCSLVGARA
jgi:hypothetical protein